MFIPLCSIILFLIIPGAASLVIPTAIFDGILIDNQTLFAQYFLIYSYF
jgi:hypothetical protein